MRIIITGARDWPVPSAVEDAIAQVADEYLVVVHGDCPTGADRQARDYCEANGITHEPHPANWNKYGRGAGPIRNQDMVDLGAQVCYAFVTPSSRGTWDCVRRAKDGGIPTSVTQLEDLI